MKIEGDGYCVEHENEEIAIRGKLSLMLEDYAPIETLLEWAVAEADGRLTLDIRNLEYLNSSGIKLLCVNLILEAADAPGLALTIRCSNRFTWQRETVPTFQDLMTDMVIAFE